MPAQPTYSIPSRTSLILLTSLAITLLISLPRFLLWQRIAAGRPSIETTLPDIFLRSFYIFLTSLLFFILHLHNRTVRISFLTIDFNSFWQRLLLSVVVFVMIDPVLLRMHWFLFHPAANEKLFRFLFNINMVITVILTMLFAQIFRLLLYNYQMRLSNASLLKTNAETKFEVLKNQVNPHFLFNSFNTINSLITTDQQAAVHFVNNMSDVYRYVLKSHELNSIPLQEELHFIGAYTHMLQGRYGNKMTITVQIPPAYLQHHLPPMALQILIENAVKHNIASNSKPLNIQVFTNETNELVVTNNLQKRHAGEPSTGLGLQNLNLRCKYLSNRHLVIRQTLTSFSVTIPLMHA